MTRTVAHHTFHVNADEVRERGKTEALGMAYLNGAHALRRFLAMHGTPSRVEWTPVAFNRDAKTWHTTVSVEASWFRVDLYWDEDDAA